MSLNIYSKAGADAAFATAAQGALADATEVEQVTLTAPLAYTLPVGTPANTVHRVTFTQDASGGHTVTYGGATVSVDLAAGASTLVEVWPDGTVVYPEATGAGASGVSTDAGNLLIAGTDGLPMLGTGDLPASASDGAYPLVNLITKGSFETDANGDGVPDGYTNGNPTKFVFAASSDAKYGSKSLAVTCTVADWRAAVNQGFAAVSGHLYYRAVWVKTSVVDAVAALWAGTAATALAIAPIPTGEWSLVSGLARSNATGSVYQHTYLQRPGDANFTPGDSFLLDGSFNIDLTAAFGAGKEPTVEEMDRLVTHFGHFDGTAGLAATTAAMLELLQSKDDALRAREARLASGVFRVGTWNAAVMYARPFVARRVISDANLDVIAMQEAFDAIDPSSLATFERTVVNYPLTSHYWHTETPTAVAGFNKGKGVASAFQMQDTTYSATPAQGVIHTTLLIGGRRVSFYCIHMPYSASQATMKTYVDALYAVVAADATTYKIVAGDFNAPRSTDDVSALGSFVAAGYTHAQLTLDWENTVQDVGDAGYLDNILVSPGLEILAADVVSAYNASDHRLLWADVAFSDSAISSALVAAKGDLIAGTDDGVTRLPVGETDGHTLVVNSATASGLAWAAPSGGDTTALYLPGVASNTITMPDSDALDITGDLDVRIKAARNDWSSGGTSSLVEKEGTAPALAWMFYTGSNQLYFRYSSDGGATQQTYVGRPINPASASQALWLRVTVDVDNGAGGHTVTMYKSSDGNNWTQLGTSQVRTGVITLATNTTAVNVGSKAGTSDAFAGHIYAAEIRNGIDGPVVAQWNGSWPHVRQRDAYGNIWTVNGTGSAWQAV